MAATRRSIYRFYGSALRETPGFVYTATSRVRTVTAIVVFLILALVPWLPKEWVAQVAQWVAELSRWWSALPVALTVLWLMAKVNYKRFVALEKHLDAALIKRHEPTPNTRRIRAECMEVVVKDDARRMAYVESLAEGIRALKMKRGAVSAAPWEDDRTRRTLIIRPVPDRITPEAIAEYVLYRDDLLYMGCRVTGWPGDEG